MKISVPDPCKIPLSNMKPVRDGFYCGSCAKKVTDFRNWSETDLQRYFKEQAGNKPCGIFKNTQIQETKPVIIVPRVDGFQLTFRQQFLYALLICFSTLFFSCGEQQTSAKITVESPYLDNLAIEVDSAETLEKNSLPLVEGQELLVVDDVVGAYEVPVMEEITAGAPMIEDIEPILEIQLPDSAQCDKTTKVETIPFVMGAVVLTSPKYPGGEDAMYVFLEKNVHYPEYEKKNNIEGKIFAEFTINEDGSISDIIIKKGVDGALNFNDEVIRVIKLMPKWKPSKQGGHPVKAKFILPFDFTLDDGKNKDEYIPLDENGKPIQK